MNMHNLCENYELLLLAGILVGTLNDEKYLQYNKEISG